MATATYPLRATLESHSVQYTASATHLVATLPSDNILLVSILSVILSSRPALVRVVKYLLSECRSQSLPPSQRSTPTRAIPPYAQIPTLHSLTQPPVGNKRKRSITHFDGIPFSVIATPLQELSECGSKEEQRTVITRKRVMGLHQSMSELSIDGQEPSEKADSAVDCCLESERDEIGSLEEEGLDYDDESDDMSESDDEDDVVLVFHRS
ncbi:uncharacterized protein L203_101777 [Cryptococcus depauperatus CBS 7841]|uniref:Uncharacterized protein n=1 Tax=Cryptococcus depauperatus CBS 7841 TaxID=1295531 RepID=A0A1E3IGU6_9TREE|nr:hypothetical protein L203_03014 [Cryptococcus depauperatus CBS 7841]